MTFTALPQFNSAVVDRLRNDVAFMDMVAGVYDEVPANAKYPHVIIDEPFETPDRTMGQNGHQCSVMLSIFTQSPSTTASGRGKAGFTVGLQIAERALSLLTDIEDDPLTVEGHDVVDVDVISIDCTREDDGKTRLVDVVIIATLEDAADAEVIAP